MTIAAENIVEKYSYSLVIATLDDDGDIERCLSSLAELDRGPNFEVIVVDQNIDSHLNQVITKFSKRLKIIHERVAFHGANRARNHGARMASGQWLGFPDDDCRYLPDTLIEVARIASDPLVGVVTGKTIDDEGNPNVLPWKQAAGEFTRWSMFGCLTEATLFVDRAIFVSVGGFDERFGPGAVYPAAEGIDLMNRLFTSMGGRKAIYAPTVKLQHPTKIPPWNRWAVSRFYTYAHGDGALIAKSPEPHMLYWGIRTLGFAALQTLFFRGWRSVAFCARLVGLLRGFVTYRLAALRS